MLSKTVRLFLCRMEFYLSGTGDQALPFELQAFEVPLAAAVRLFESETTALEGKLLPSLERLTAKVSLQFGYTTRLWGYKAMTLVMYCMLLEQGLPSLPFKACQTSHTKALLQSDDTYFFWAVMQSRHAFAALLSIHGPYSGVQAGVASCANQQGYSEQIASQSETPDRGEPLQEPNTNII